MRVTRRNPVSVAVTTLIVWLSPLAAGISVPTGKLTPITPARATPPPVNPRAPSAPAPVVEYSEEHPEPPPLNPSHVPPTFNYFDTLARHHVFYVPVRYRNYNNFNPSSNSIDYEPPHKYYGQTLGKNVAYKQRTPIDWKSRFNPQYKVQPTRQQQYTQYSVQPTPQQQQQYTQYSVQPTPQQYTQYSAQPTPQQQQEQQYSLQPTNQQQQQEQQYSLQPTNQQQRQEAASTQAASTALPTVTGKGSYDVTGKGGSKSDTEYYNKDDWSKKSYPKKVPATPKKFAGHKF